MKKTTVRYGGSGPRSRHEAARDDHRLEGISGAPPKSTGTIAPRKLQCYSVACLDMPQLEFGDKIVLPASVLLELQCFKVATPMLFHIRSFGTLHADSNAASTGFAQYCSVQEFSAPAGQAFIPYWMMQNLHIGEGAHVILTNVVDIPRGIYCRLQPEDASFLDIAAEIGPKLLMESALRRYSVLSVDETILIDHGNQRFYVKVVELKPGAVVSLLGDVDLEMDFMAPPSADVRRPQSGGNPESEPRKTKQDAHHVAVPVENRASITTNQCFATPVGFGRRLGDGVCVADQASQLNDAETVSKRKETVPGTASLQAARLKMIASSGSPHELRTEMLAKRADTESLAKDVRLSQAAFATEGQRLGGRGNAISTIVELSPAHDLPDPPVSPAPTPVAITARETNPSCPLCLSELSRDNLELHRMRCSKNPSYHKFKCQVCDAKVLEKDRAVHLHCVDCGQLFTHDTEVAAHVETFHNATHPCLDCGGGTSFTLTELELHRKTTCPQALELCTLCGFKIKQKDMAGHTKACSSRTERCEICQKYIKIVDLDDHIVACVSDRDARAMSSSSPPPPIAPHLSNQHEHQPPTATATTLECIYCSKSSFIDRRQFDRHVNQECLVARSFRSPMAKPSGGGDVKSLIQGKLKRRADATALSDSSSRLALEPLVSSQRSVSNNQHDTSVHVKRADPLVRLLPAKPQSVPHTTKPTRAKTMQKQPPRPTQLESLPVKPAPPRPQGDSLGGLFIANTTNSHRTRATGTTGVAQQARRQPAKGNATRRLQTLSQQA